MELLNKFLTCQTKLLKYFNYRNDGQAFIINDCTEYWWERHIGLVRYAKNLEDLKDIVAKEYYQCYYAQNFHSDSSFFAGARYTLICAKQVRSGSLYLNIFKNELEVFEGTTPTTSTTSSKEEE